MALNSLAALHSGKSRLAASLPGIRNYSVAVTEEGNNVVFLHKIVPGGADKSYGVHVAQLAGLPQGVINLPTLFIAHRFIGPAHLAERFQG